jgi:hypothetical protein
VSGEPGELITRYWPNPRIVIDAEDRAALDRLATMDGVLAFERNGTGANVDVDRLSRVPDLINGLTSAGVRLTKVVPHQPTLEELYFAVRQRGAR